MVKTLSKAHRKYEYQKKRAGDASEAFPACQARQNCVAKAKPLASSVPAAKADAKGTKQKSAVQDDRKVKKHLRYRRRDGIQGRQGDG